MPACVSSPAFTISYFQYYLAAKRAPHYWPQPLLHLSVRLETVLCPWPWPFFLLLLLLSMTLLGSWACKSLFLTPPRSIIQHKRRLPTERWKCCSWLF